MRARACRGMPARGRLCESASAGESRQDDAPHAATFPCPSRKGCPSGRRAGLQPIASVLVCGEVASSVKKCRANYTRKTEKMANFVLGILRAAADRLVNKGRAHKSPTKSLVNLDLRRCRPL